MTNCFRTYGFGILIVGVCAASLPCAGAATIVITTGKVEGAPGREVHIPIIIKGAKEVKGGVTGLEIQFNYDPAVLTFKKVDKGPASPNATVAPSVDEKLNPGIVGLAFMCGSKTPGSKEMASITEDGAIIDLTFVVNEKAATGQKAPLKLAKSRAEDSGDPPLEMNVDAEDGEFIVSGGGLAGLPWLWIAIGAGAFLFLVLLIVLLSRRRGGYEYKPTYGAPPHAAPPYASPAPPAGAALPRFTPEGATTLAHTCTKCGGVIQLPRAMAGQSFQCGACGAAQVAGS